MGLQNLLLQAAEPYIVLSIIPPSVKLTLKNLDKPSHAMPLSVLGRWIKRLLEIYKNFRFKVTQINFHFLTSQDFADYLP
jgi:hypothetical protein